MSDKIEQSLRSLGAKLPAPQLELSDDQKDALIATLGGPLTAQSILAAKKDFPTQRIPFLFSSLDTQAIVNLLHNDMDSALERALASKKRKKAEDRSR